MKSFYFPPLPRGSLLCCRDASPPCSPIRKSGMQCLRNGSAPLQELSSLTASWPCIRTRKSLTGLEPRYLVLVSERSPVTGSRTVRRSTPFLTPAKQKGPRSKQGVTYHMHNSKQLREAVSEELAVCFPSCRYNPPLQPRF